MGNALNPSIILAGREPQFANPLTQGAQALNLANAVHDIPQQQQEQQQRLQAAQLENTQRQQQITATQKALSDQDLVRQAFAQDIAEQKAARDQSQPLGAAAALPGSSGAPPVDAESGDPSGTPPAMPSGTAGPGTTPGPSTGPPANALANQQLPMGAPATSGAVPGQPPPPSITPRWSRISDILGQQGRWDLASQTIAPVMAQHAKDVEAQKNQISNMDAVAKATSAVFANATDQTSWQAGRALVDKLGGNSALIPAQFSPQAQKQVADQTSSLKDKADAAKANADADLTHAKTLQEVRQLAAVRFGGLPDPSEADLTAELMKQQFPHSSMDIDQLRKAYGNGGPDGIAKVIVAGKNPFVVGSEKATAMPPQKIAQMNGANQVRWDAANSGQPFPAALKLTADSTPEDVDRIEKVLAGTESAQGSAATRAAAAAQNSATNSFRQIAADTAKAQKDQATQDREEKAGLKWVTYTDPSTNQQVAAPMSVAKAASATDMAELPTAEVREVQNARHAVHLMTKIGDPAKPETNGVLQLIDSLDKDGKLGILASRYNKFLTTGLGTEPGDDPRIVTLINKNMLADTGTMLAHFGASGGRSPQMLKHFTDLSDTGKMDAGTLRAGTKAVADYMTDRALMPPTAATAPSAAPVVNSSVPNGPTPATHNFSASAWARANPRGNVIAAIAAAKQQGLNVVP